MGEIADALRRARTDREKSDAPSPRTEDVDPASVRTPPRESDPRAASPARGAATSSPPPDTRDPASPSPAWDGAATGDRLVISRDKTGPWVARMVVVQKGGGAEAYRHFALRVRREIDALGQRSVMIVSGLRQEGKTTTSCNLALALASMSGGRRIALADLDLRRPSIGDSFEIRPKLGIEGVLQGKADLRQICVRTDLPSLDVFPVGAPVKSPHELLAGPPLSNLMRELHESYDIVVIDSPPILLVPDTGLIMPHVGSCIAVMRSRRTRRATFNTMLGMLPPRKLIGTLVNDAHLPRHTKDYGYYLRDDEPLPSDES